MAEAKNILQQIAELRRQDREQALRQIPETELLRQTELVPPPKSLYDSLKSKDGIRIIAELKKASPSKGLIRPDFQFEQFAAEYLEAGAAAISVLTEPHFFQGSLEYLRKVAGLARGTSVPVLRKDFLTDRYELLEARAAGADAVLLIAALIPDDARFAELLAAAHGLGMDALCEAHDETEVKRLLGLGARVIGVNSRDLRTFHTDIRGTGRLLELIPPNCAAVAESGIRSAEDFADLPADAYLIGETLMRHEHPGEKLRELRGGKPCIR
ncbi:MAG: indole-3-glycerol phosphate synthase TrpC [Lentisphaeria bacterium]|nr:indole-3-glycerol phosphate synthase TrpC [Lentisphaeria bacterium]